MWPMIGRAGSDPSWQRYQRDAEDGEREVGYAFQVMQDTDNKIGSQSEADGGT